MKVKVDWDCEEENVNLPEEVVVPDEVDEEEVADWLSDEYGWCVNSWYVVPVVIKQGTKVIYRGCWGEDVPKEATVINVVKCKEIGEKYGDTVDEVTFNEKDYCTFDLDDGHWCYGTQVDAVVGQEEVSDPEDEAEPEEEIEVRITFRSEIYIKGKSIEEIEDKWEEIGLFSADALEHNADFIEICSSERVDDGSYEDVGI